MLNEPAYGFLKIDKEALAQALEAVRRRICVYNMGTRMDQDARCDCKYGLSIDKLVSGEVKYSPSSEQTGCPELRSVIYILLHGEENVKNDLAPDLFVALLAGGTSPRSEAAAGMEEDDILYGDVVP